MRSWRKAAEGRGPMPMREQVIRVECYSGYKADERPVRMNLIDGAREVVAIEDRWYSPGATFFLVMAKHVTVAVVHQDAKESRPGGITAILNRHDLPGSVYQIHPHGALVRLISGIALHADNFFTHGHGPAPFCGSLPAPRSRRRPGK